MIIPNTAKIVEVNLKFMTLLRWLTRSGKAVDAAGTMYAVYSTNICRGDSIFSLTSEFAYLIRIKYLLTERHLNRNPQQLAVAELFPQLPHPQQKEL